MLHVVARITVKPGCMEKFLKIFKANIPAVKAEKGCHGYLPCLDVGTGFAEQDNYSPNCATILECWESKEILAQHLASKHMVQYAKDVADLVEGMKLTVVEEA